MSSGSVPGDARRRTIPLAASASLAAATALSFGVGDVGAATAPATVAPIDQPGAEIHCVLHIIGKHEDGEYITEDLGCFPTLAEALSATHTIPDSKLARLSPALRATVLAAGASTSLGTHYADANRTGSSISVTGSNCDGGYLNLSTDWQNKISSTSGFCPVTRFFDSPSKTGKAEDTNPGTWNLVKLNDQSESIQYATT